MKSREINLLLIEDDPIDRMAFERFVRNENLPYRYVLAGSVTDARTALNSGQFDIVLADYLLGDGTAFDLFDNLKNTPMIIVTGIGDEKVAVQAMKSGASDYLTKDTEGSYLKTLPFTVENALSRKRTEEELVKYREHLEELVKERTSELKAEIDVRKRAEKERDRLFNLSIDLLSIAGFDGYFKQINPAWTKALGWTEAELLCKPWIEFVHPEDFAGVKSVAEKLAGGKPVHAFENRFLCQDGSYRWFSWNSFPLQDDQLIFSVTRDITDAKNVKENQKLLQDQLFHAQKMEAIGTLAGGIAHDFNNIISAIMGYTELAMLHELHDNHPARQSLEQVLKASHRAKDLVHQILTFSRQREQELKPIKVTPIVKESLKFLRASLPSTIRISHALKAESDVILGDPSQFHQVLMNLCTNAAHAMHQQGGILEVRLEETQMSVGDGNVNHQLAAEPCLKLTIRDTGHGMRRSVMERIFEPYFTTKPQGEGTGLGLAVVHGIVKNFGGKIVVHSEPGKGSTFSVFLPRIESKAVSELKSLEPIHAGHERILYIDDEKSLAVLGKRMLDRLGYDVTTMTDSLEALDTFRSRPHEFDLVITDMTMPHLTGDRLARELLGIRPDIPIILCTGYSDLISEELAKNIGIREFITKPVVLYDIAKAIRRALGERL